MYYDLESETKQVVALKPTTVSDNTVTNTAEVDSFGFGSGKVIFYTGTLTTEAATFTIKLQETDTTGTGYTDVASDFVIGSANFTGANDDSVFSIGYVGKKRYFRAVITPADNAAAATFGAIAVLGDPINIPVG